MSEPIQIISKESYTTFGKHSKSPSKIVWRNILIFIYLHYEAFYGLYYLFSGNVKLLTFIWTYFYLLCSIQGTGSGVHRLWSHRAYKATLPLRILLCIFQTISLQNHIWEWCRDHRLHHKFTDTNADPHNAKRGFFFSHMGWLLVRKHPDVKTKGKTIDLSDLEADPVVMFQKKYYLILAPIFCFAIPTLVPWYFWNENIFVAWAFCANLRYMLSLHGTWLVNSAAHIYGTRPYDKNIQPTENLSVSYLTMGEGWHNYHHIFPWDYKAAELGNNRFNNFSARFIEFMGRIGWAYDLKTVSKELIEKRAKRTGDGTRMGDGTDDGTECYQGVVWGWDDNTMDQEDRTLAEISHQKLKM